MIHHTIHFPIAYDQPDLSSNSVQRAEIVRLLRSLERDSVILVDGRLVIPQQLAAAVQKWPQGRQRDEAVKLLLRLDRIRRFVPVAGYKPDVSCRRTDCQQATGIVRLGRMRPALILLPDHCECRSDCLARSPAVVPVSECSTCVFCTERENFGSVVFDHDTPKTTVERRLPSSMHSSSRSSVYTRIAHFINCCRVRRSMRT